MDALLFGDSDPIARHRSRVLSDSGQMQNLPFARAVAQWLRQSGEQDKTLLLALPGAGVKTRDSGLDRFITKLYSMQLLANDLTQTTEVNQPYLTGLIAPGDVISLMNPNAGSRHFEFPQISFDANTAWSVTFVINPSGHESNVFTNGLILGDAFVASTNSQIRLRGNGLGRNLAVNAAGTIVEATSIPLALGKYNVCQITYTPTGTGIGRLVLYVNNQSFSAEGINGYAVFKYLGKNAPASSTTGFYGALPYLRIGGVMSASQVASETAMLRALIPEIPSVTIGNQTWSIRNIDVAVTPAGNIIQEMQANSAVEKLTGWNFTVGWTPLTASVIDADSFNIDVTNGYLAKTGVTTVGKYYKITIAGTSAAGITNFRILGTAVYKEGLTGSFSTEFIVKADATALFLRAFGTGQIDITTLSLQELGWTNSTEIYDAVYAATSGDAATKNYAALKEAAMWCSHSNTEANQVVFGKIYNGYAAALLDADMVSSGYGWRVPSQTDYNTLITTLGGTSIAAGKMKVAGTTYWMTPNEGATNESGFSLVGGGARIDHNGLFTTLKERGYLWTTTFQYLFALLSNSANIIGSGGNVKLGCSIRLIKT